MVVVQNHRMLSPSGNCSVSQPAANQYYALHEPWIKRVQLRSLVNFSLLFQICELMREAFLLRQLHQLQQCRFVLGVRDVPALSALTVGRSSVVSESAAKCGDSNQRKQ
uniref:(northern house mosquito) hypothetical protein n=1 Tax=Culex pipiens TaxID=7175 RepID=A0A8D8GVJ4_CULPI